MEILEHLNQCLAHLQYVQNYSPLTTASMRSAITLFVKMTKTEDLKGLTQHKVEDWLIEGRIKRNWRAATYIDYHKRMSTFIAWLVKR
jgi:hypothetical protein